MKTLMKFLAPAAAIAAVSALALAAPDNKTPDVQGDPAPLEAPAPAAPKVLDAKDIALLDAFPAVEAARSRSFRAQRVELAPGQTFMSLSAPERPAITYVTQGAVNETPAGGAAAVKRETGYASFDKGGQVLSWTNTGSQNAILLYVEIAPAP